MTHAVEHSAAAPHEWAALRTPQFPRPGPRATVLLPVGSTEQHGPHLPVQVDTLLADTVARAAAARCANRQDVLVLPPLWVSLAEHHMGLPGSLTLDFATLYAFIRCVVRSVQRQGWQRVLLVNGHGGNVSALGVVADGLAAEFGCTVASVTYWQVAAGDFGGILEAQNNLAHACEAETSMLLHLRPGLVDTDAAAQVDAPATGFVETAGFYRWRPITDWSSSGVVGVPAAACADKGRRLLEAAADAVARCIEDEGLWTTRAAAPAPQRRDAGAASTPGDVRCGGVDGLG